ncbi:ATP-binding cassette domain-containing protein, partial [Roseomonas sp. DSM 102946]|nr:ATP-binding cassette domain-containing protein [Roseomonas sp. DSM 102946]
MSLLVAQGLRKSFGGVTAVSDVSFALAAGEMLALIGPNGAGKSTCFNMVGGQLRPDAGRLTLEGREIAGLSPRAIARRGVGRTFQVTATFGSMT